jgi:histidinol-phosphate aminotransferase
MDKKTPADLMRRDLKDMEDYRPPVRRGECKLDSNESPFGLPEDLRRKLIEWLENEENLNRYPDTANTRLREALAGLWGISPENVACGAGSDQMIDNVCRVFLEPGDYVVTQSPTFGMFAVSARLNHGRVRGVPFRGDTAGLVRVAEETEAKILFLCSPNNPTGQSLPREQIRSVLENTGGIVVVDEAYGEFAQSPIQSPIQSSIQSSMIPHIGEYPRMIVLRTFSKSFGLAGARVGYAAADAGTIALLGRAKAPFNISTLSQLLAAWAVENAPEYAERVEYLNRQRGELFRDLEKIPWLRVERSDGNFLYVRSEWDVYSLLMEHGIAVRKQAGTGKAHCVRITVGTAEENKKVLEALCSAGLS